MEEISREEFEALQAKHDALLKSASLLCKWFGDWEMFKSSSSYLNQARSYRRKTEDLIKAENEERKSKQRKLFN